MPFDMSAYKNLYLKTSREYIKGLKKNLAVLSKAPTDKHAIFEIFRSAHSLRSQSDVMGYTQTAKLCEVAEKLFREIKESKRLYIHTMQSIILDCAVSLERSIDNIKKTGKEIDLSQKLKKYKKALSFEF